MSDSPATGKKTIQMRVTVPINVYAYLGYLAKTTGMGGAEGDVAAFLLQTATEQMRDTDRYRMAFDGGEKS